MSKNKKTIINSLFGNDSKDIERVVLKCFLRIIKDNGSYMLYRRGVNNTGIMKALLKNRKYSSSDNPFSTASSTDEVVNILKRITNDMAKSNGKKRGSKDLDRYEIVTMTINHLLHFFMETNGIAMKRLCELGEEIYCMSCNRLFGDTMEDIEKQNEEEMASVSNIDQLKAKLFQDFISDLQKGLIPSSMNFDEYAKSKINSSEQVFVNDGEQVGYMLGMAPDSRMMDDGDESYFFENDHQ